MPDVYPDGIRRAVSICVPFCGRPVPFQWALAFKGVAPPPNMHGLFFASVNRPVDAARNWLCEKSLENYVRYIAMFDDDVIMPANVLDRMIFQMDNHPEIDVLTGIYCSKTDPPFPQVYKPITGTGPFWDWKVGELFPIEGCGAGCMMIRAESLAKIEKPYFAFVRETKVINEVPYRDEWTEDLFFNRKMLQAGGKIYADGGILCRHVEVNTGEMFELPKDSLPWQNRTDPADPSVDISRAMKIPGFITIPELEWLARQAKRHQRIVEIGSYLGRSTRALADNTSGKVFAVDDFYGPRDIALSEATRKGLLEKFAQNMEGLSLERLQAFMVDHRTLGGMKVNPDMVFIDGSHEYSDVKADIETWKAALLPGGLICGHDFDNGWPGLTQAVKELIPDVKVEPGTTLWWAEV
jgi:Methyltransferase domain